MKLTTNFTLEEMLESKTARGNNFFEQWTPPSEVVDNLRDLCVNLLQPLRDAIGEPIIISSGYRCDRVNKKIKGVSNSQHKTGRAVDCEYSGGNQIIIDKVKELNLPFDQMIDEQNLDWVHLSYDKNQCRRQMLRMVDGKYTVME